MTKEDFAEMLRKAGLDSVPQDDIAAALPGAEQLAEQARKIRHVVASDDD